MNSKTLNIIFIGRNTFPTGGAMTKRHRYYIDYLLTLENVHITNICTWQDDLGHNEEEGLYNKRVKYYNTRIPKKLSSIFAISDWCKKILKDSFLPYGKNVAIFCSYFSIEQIPVMLYAKKLGYKIVCDVVENYDAKGGNMTTPLRIAFKLSKLFCYKKTDAFIVISNQIGEVYQKYQKPMLMLTNSAPINNANPKSTFHSPMKVVYTGTFADKDGLCYLVEAFDKFTSKFGNVAELLLIGKGKGDEKMEHIIKSNPQITKMGFVTDDVLEKTQQEADILCMTRCNSEFANYGFPFKLSEYLATGNTVLATSVGDVALYIKDKENGLLVSPNNNQAIADALGYAFTHQTECMKMGKKGVQTIKESFSVEKNGDKLYKFIVNLWQL